MATAPMAKRTVIRYRGGSVTATLGAIIKLLGQQQLGWSQALTDTEAERRRPYGSVRVSRSSAGVPCEVQFADGEVWTYRVTGLQKDFIRHFLSDSDGNQVTTIKFPRKTRYGAIPQTIVP